MGMPGLRYEGRFLMRGRGLSAEGPPKIRPFCFGKGLSEVRYSATSAPALRNEFYLAPLLESLKCTSVQGIYTCCSWGHPSPSS